MTTFKICIIKSDRSIELPAISPETAARCNEAVFLQFAKEVAKVAARIEAERAQLRLLQDDNNDHDYDSATLPPLQEMATT